MSGGQLVVSFPTTFLQASAVITLEVGGLTNTSTPGSYAMAIAALTGTRTLDAGVAPAVALTSTALTSLSWAVDSTAVRATGVSSTVGFGLSAGATLTTITMSVPPSTGGTPAVGTVTPTALAGGSVTLSGQTLTYTLPAATTVAAGTNVSVQITGLTNTPTAQTYAATVTVLNGSTTVSSGATPAITFTATALTALSWATTSTTAGAAASYTFGFTTSSATNLSSVSMSVPAGTTGTPALGTVTFVSTSQGTQALGSPKISLAGTKLTMTFTALFVDRGTHVSIQVNGLTNTTAVGTYTSAITTSSNTGAVDSGTTPSVTLAAASLTSPGWSVSSTAVKQTGVAYTFTASPSAAVTVSGFRMTVPSDTGGTPKVGAVQPAAIAGGTVTLSGSTLVYTFPATTLPSGSAVSIEIDNLTNTAVAGSYVSTITATNDGSPVASGTAAALGFTATVLTSPTWSVSSAYAAAAGVSYTFGFTTASSTTLTGVQFALPTGTGGTPVLGTITAQAPGRGTIALSGTAVSLSGSVLTLTFSNVNVPAGATFSVQVNGMTNPAGPGSYTTTIATRFGASSVDSGTTPVVTLVARYVTLAPPSSLSWVAPTLGGNGATVVDTRPADQGYSVVDATGTNAGWNVTVSATTFTDGLHTLPNAGTFSVNGSVTTPTSTAAPAATCITLCTTPVNRVSYPVSVSTAVSAPPAVQIFSAAAGSGAGAFTIGGSTSSAPLGWWVHIPATAYAGTYTSTITFSISAGP
jgi:hypothetical protein